MPHSRRRGIPTYLTRNGNVWLDIVWLSEGFVLNGVLISSLFVLFGVGVNVITANSSTTLQSCKLISNCQCIKIRYSFKSKTGYKFLREALKRSKFFLKKGSKISDFCLEQGQGFSTGDAPPYPNIC